MTLRIAGVKFVKSGILLSGVSAESKRSLRALRLGGEQKG